MRDLIAASIAEGRDAENLRFDLQRKFHVCSNFRWESYCPEILVRVRYAHAERAPTDLAGAWCKFEGLGLRVEGVEGLKGFGAHEGRALGERRRGQPPFGLSPPNTPLAEEGRACGRVGALERSSGRIGRAMRRAAAAAARADMVAMVPGEGPRKVSQFWVGLRGLGERMGCGNLGRGGIQKG
jgi:hypothetical protein